MKKTLHGKRHIRARWTVMIGRDKRKIRKFDRGLAALAKAIKLYKSKQFAEAWTRSINAMVDAINKAGIALQNLGNHELRKT